MKRTFDELRELILQELCHGQQSINQLSATTGINWRTVRQHLEFLVMQGDVTEKVSSGYVRIFQATKHGMAKVATVSEEEAAHSIEIKINGRTARIGRVEIR